MTTISLAEMKQAFDGEISLPRRPIVITFDDGYESFIHEGLPALKSQNMKATVFLVSGHVGGANEWDIAKGDVREGLMDLAQLLKAGEQGTELGVHTCSHPNLAMLSHDQARREIVRSKEESEAAIGRRLDFFCYPYGAQNVDVRGMVREAGFLGATTTEMHGNDSTTDPFRWGRFGINDRYTLLPFLVRLLQGRIKGLK